MQTSYAEDDLADGRAALLSGWRIGFILHGSLAVEMAMKLAMANDRATPARGWPAPTTTTVAWPACAQRFK